MAFNSPSPISPPLRSRSPPPQPLNKKDRKRNLQMSQIQDLSNDFKDNRGAHFHRQVVTLQNDLSLVTKAELYEPEALDDAPASIADFVQAVAAGTPYHSNISSMAGKWYSEFAHEVNEAKETRDIELTQLMTEHEHRLDRIKYDCDYRLLVAKKECEFLSDTLRQRLIHQLNSRKQRLLKEKEHLDIADTNTLLLHPQQFTITNPSSPGSAGQSHRKTRHTRHKVDMDEVGTGLTGEPLNKRKRKAVDDDAGSPSRDGILTPAERPNKRTHMPQAAPLFSIDTLFTDKELNMQSHAAHVAARHFFITNPPAQPNGASTRKTSDSNPSTDSPSSPHSDSDAPAAPEMERSTSQNVHVTRSTRNTVGTLNGSTRLDILSDAAATSSERRALPYATLHSYNPKNGLNVPPVSALMPEEIDDDLERMQAAKALPKGKMDEKVVEEALKSLPGGRSTLAVDWPSYMGVHLVDVERAVH